PRRFRWMVPGTPKSGCLVQRHASSPQGHAGRWVIHFKRIAGSWRVCGHGPRVIAVHLRTRCGSMELIVPPRTRGVPGRLVSVAGEEGAERGEGKKGHGGAQG